MRHLSPSQKKAVGKLLLLALAAAGIILLAGRLAQRSRDPDRLGEDTNENRIAYLASLGWSVGRDPLSEQTIRLPGTFPEVLKEYNELQKEQSFDLEKYAGKEIRMYVYAVEDPPSGQESLCSLYVYKDRVIGGDVHTVAHDGEMLKLR